MALLTLAAVLVMAASLWRLGAGGLLRALAIALLLLALFNPQLRQEERTPLDNIALIVTDHSDSQKITNRLKLSLKLEKKLKASLKALPNLEVRTKKGGVLDDADRNGTTLIRDMNDALADIPRDRLAGVFLITDGEVHDVPDNIKALGLKAPVHVLLTGKKNEFDRRIELIEAPRFGLVDTTRQIKLKIVQNGTPTDAQSGKGVGSITKLRVRREGQPEQLLRVRVGEELTLDFEFPHAGQNILELELEELPGELTHVNNRMVLTAEGVRENLRVLLVSGEPHPGERTWRNLLRSDAAVDLVHFTILRPPEKQDATPINQLSLIAFPTRELFSEKLNDFDLIIFDRYRRRGVLPLIYLDNVARYVEEGGAVLLAAGDQYAARRSLARTPLAQILPALPTGAVTTRPYKPRITKAGKRHPVTSTLPGGRGDNPAWGRWFRLIDTDVMSGDVLMSGPDDKPLLVLDRRGKGRVATLLSDHAWLWARGYDGGGPYTALFRRLAHWLMKEPDLEEEYLSAKSRGRKLTIEHRSMLDKVEPVAVTSPTGEKLTIELKQKRPGVWRKTIEADVAGLYRLKSGELTAAVYVGRINSKELSVVTATEDKLKAVAKATGGALVWQKQLGAKSKDDARIPRLLATGPGRQMYGPGWLAIADRHAYRIKNLRLIPLFSGLIALALLLAALSLTWLREGR